MKCSLCSLFALCLVTLAPAQAHEPLWVYRYDGPGGNNDDARRVELGADGNLYVAGWCTDSSEAGDFLVISLTPEGEERWVYRYNGPGSGWDEAAGLACGPDRHIYVCGYSQDSVDRFDIVVVSLDTSGTERWVYRYDWKGEQDRAYDIVFGDDSNLYLTGTVQDRQGSGVDLCAISLTSSGAERWVYRYAGPDSSTDDGRVLTQGPNGSIYVAGVITTRSDDIGVVCLSPDSGTEQWVYSYDGPGSGYDYPNSIACDSEGNVFVGGASWGHDTLWYDMTVVSLTPEGDERWVFRRVGPGNDMVEAVCTGPGAELYASGMFTRDTGGARPKTEFAVLSLDTAGAENWMYHDFPGGSYNMTVGENNNVYACGYASVNVNNEFAVASLRPGGAERWVSQYKGNGGSNAARWVTWGSDGYVYATGFAMGKSGLPDILAMGLESSAGIRQTVDSRRVAKPRLPTLVTSTLALRPTDYRTPSTAALYSIDGRRVAVLKPGANDIGYLAPGVYFVRQGSRGQGSKETKEKIVKLK